MSKKKDFILWCEEASKVYPMMKEVEDYFNLLKAIPDKEKPLFTEKGLLILQYMKDNKDNYSNMFKAKDIAEGLNIISKSVAGSCKKLVADGYLDKMEGKPVIYLLTEKGINVDLSNIVVDNE